MDPQARLVLEASWSAVEDAGYSRAGLKASAGGRDVGVFTGVMNMPWRLLGLPAAEAGLVVQGNHWSIANRVSHGFDFGGPSLAVDTGCSASLTALHLACGSLRRGECGVALAGGVNLILHPVQQVELSRTGVLARGEACHVFGAAADGFVQGEGVGVAVLKPLQRALADGDHIHGVILGSAINAGGRTAGYTVPSPRAQAAVVRAALAAALVPADSIGYVECHGTATALGDPVEIVGLGDGLRAAGRDAQAAPVVIGSVKSNIGHLESAAGIAGLAKLLLQLRHGEIVPSLHADPPNPRIDFAAGPFEVAREARPWVAPIHAAGDRQPRRGGLSSFGAGGANAHLVAEEPPPRPAPAPAAGPFLVPLSARTEAALREAARRLSAHLASTTDALADIAWTLSTGREALEERLALVAADSAALRTALERWLDNPADPGIARGSAAPGRDGAEAARTLPHDLPAMARHWCAGGAVDWPALFRGGSRRRVRLPTYAFARERCWLPDLPANHPAAPVATPAATPGPLLGPALPSLAAEARWTVTLDATHPVLAHHQVGGRPLLPGVAALELVATALRQLGRDADALHLRDLAWLAPAEAADGRLAAELVLRPSREEALTFALEIGGKPLLRGRLQSAGAEAPAAAPVADPGRCTERLEGLAIYARLDALGLRYGPGFRAIAALAMGEAEAISDVVMPEVPALSACTLHPGLLDAVLQTAAMLVLRRPDARRMLPMAVEAVDVLAPRLPRLGRVEARLLTPPDRLDIAAFDAVLRDESGRVAVRFGGLAGRVDRALPAAAIAAAPPPEREDPPLGDWFLAPAWVPQQAEPVAAPARPLILVATPAIASALPGARLLPEEAWAAAVEAASPDALVLACGEHPATPLAVFRALRALRRARGPGRHARVLLLAEEAASGLATPWCAAAMGLLRVASREWPDWSLAWAWLDRWAEAPSALTDPGDALAREVAWRSGRRLVRAMRPLALQAPASPAPPVWRQGGHALILGGAGGIGLALARRLARRHGIRLTLVGRRAESDASVAAALSTLRQEGAEALYVRGDAAMPGEMARAAAAARERFGPLHAAIHSAIVMQDASLDRMEEASFRAALTVKAEGSIALAEAVAEERLDVLALFSSVNAFAANAGQANYVAGCAFKDAFGLTLAEARGVPVRVVNWGYWGEVGRVADPAHRERLARRGVVPIATQEGLAALDRALALPGVRQVAVLKAQPQLRAALGVLAPPPATPGFAALVDRLRAHVAAQADVMAGAWDEYAALEALSCRRLLAWWDATGALPPGARASATELAARIGVVPRHARLFAALLEVLEREGALARQGDVLSGCAAGAGDVPADLAAFSAAHPAFAPHVTLLEACSEAYTDVLRGTRLATEVMFPDSSLALVEGIYRGNRMSDFCNRLVAETVAEAAAARVAAPVRVLEIGAGTGGTTRSILPRLEALGAAEYIYTDISLAFAKFGRLEFGTDRPWLTARALDISRDPGAQGLEPGGCDIVLGANVVHATPDLVRSLTHARSLLTPGGVLVLYEMTAIHDFGTLTFGLLDGWWMATDARLPHAPLLDAAGWRERLAAAGFAEVALLSEPGLQEEQAFRHAVIIARNPAPEEAAPVAPTGAGERQPAGAAGAVPRTGGMRERLRLRADAAAEDPPDAPPELVALIRGTVAEALGMRVEDVRIERSFADYGADSILGVELIEGLAARLGIALNPTVLFSHQSVEKLARHLAARHGASLAERLRLHEAPAEPSDCAAEPLAAPGAPAQARPAGPAPIAVIGRAGRFPGADDIESLWRNLASGTDSVTEVPRSRWDHPPLHDPRPQLAGRTVCRHGGFLSDIAAFDPIFFGLSPTEAAVTDPQQRLFLEAAWHALEDAGHGPAALAGLACGVFAGTVAGDYEARLREAGREPDARSFTGNAASMLAARIAYRLDLRGPCLSVDTACSSSLVALHLACESLRRGECDLALAGGVAAMATPAFYLAASQAGMLSPSGRCRTLDAGADGFVPAEAVACVVLKRLPDALRDGDEVRGVILATGVNQDGASNGITAPNGAAQAALLREVWARAGITPAELGYVELHGTGTRLGDPVEIQALREAFGDGTVPPGRCAIGSAKANLGHTLAAAGVVGLIKAMLVLRHRAIPPAVNFAGPNPLLGLDADAPFRVPRSAEPWPEGEGAPRCVAVSSFGFSGTNAHAVLAPPPPPQEAPRPPARTWHLAALSAETEVALERRIADLVAWMDAHPEAAIADVCATLALGRAHHRPPHRAVFLARDLAGLRAALLAPSEPPHDAEEETNALAAAYLSGGTPDWPSLHPPGSFRRLALPLYPFARRRCWPEEAEAPPRAADIPAPATPATSRLFAAVMEDLALTDGGGGGGA